MVNPNAPDTNAWSITVAGLTDGGQDPAPWIGTFRLGYREDLSNPEAGDYIWKDSNPGMPTNSDEGRYLLEYAYGDGTNSTLSIIALINGTSAMSTYNRVILNMNMMVAQTMDYVSGNGLGYVDNWPATVTVTPVA